VKFEKVEPPRRFSVGEKRQIEMKDCGRISLAPDEQVTFLTEDGAQYDVARKDWGFYATPSLNGRLRSFHLRAVLVKNRNTGRYFVVLVEEGKEPLFERYLEDEDQVVVRWLDSSSALDGLGS
jgi:hypothetical protein